MEPEPPKEPLMLDNKSNGMSVDFSSGSMSISLDSLGPVIVNIDGTISRISNWDQMTEREREVTMRRIALRNK